MAEGREYLFLPSERAQVFPLHKAICAEPSCTDSCPWLPGEWASPRPSSAGGSATARIISSPRSMPPQL